MDFVSKMMDFVSKMTDFVSKMMDCVLTNDEYRCTGQAAADLAGRTGL